MAIGYKTLNIVLNINTLRFNYFRVTAYTALAFRQAKTYIYVDEKIIENALGWLVDNQRPNGGFYETGNIIHLELQNRDGNSLALTAFVTMAFLESGYVRIQFCFDFSCYLLPLF